MPSRLPTHQRHGYSFVDCLVPSRVFLPQGLSALLSFLKSHLTLDLGIFIAPSFLVISINKGSNILHLERKVSRQQKYIFRNFKKKTHQFLICQTFCWVPGRQ